MLGLSGPPAPSHRALFRPIRTRSFLAILALAVHGFLSLVMIGACSIRIGLLHQIQAHVQVQRADLLASNAFMLVGSRIQLGVAILAAVAFLLWFYRAQQNLLAFRPEPLEFSPAQAAGSFFIPFVNLVRPFSVMREIWKASDPALPPFGSNLYDTAPVSLLVPAWWTLFLARGVIAWLALLPNLGTEHTVDTLLTSAQILRVDFAVSSIAAGLACTLVFLVRRRQENLAEQLAVFEQAGVF